MSQQPLPQPDPEEVRRVVDPHESHGQPVHSEEDEAGGNPKHLKCPRCGEVPLHYKLHLQYCAVVRK